MKIVADQHHQFSDLQQSEPIQHEKIQRAAEVNSTSEDWAHYRFALVKCLPMITPIPQLRDPVYRHV
jgi:hypothetical protein